MASQKLKGITIEIDGNTSKLNDSLKNVTKLISSANSELKDVNKLLKLDPTNTTLLAQKQKILADNISATSEKLKQLKTAKEQAEQTGNLDKNSQEYRELEREIINTENYLKKLTDEETENKKALDDGANSLDKFKQGEDDIGNGAIKAGDLIKANLISDAIKKGLETMVDLTKKVGSALIDMGKQSLESYAEYEQLVGGVETLFKDSADVVEGYAENAYKTAGLSANDYMETVTSFSASLLQSLGGDTEEAAKVADMAITDMADNSNKFGTDMSSLQNAYQGFAKQNYTMLDNLKLGYGGTKTEMERLLSDAEKLTGEKYDISNLDDVYKAIHAIQEETNVTGTTAKEAGTTISGSASSMKAAWDNLLTGIADDNADMDSLVNNLVDSIGTALDNILPRVGIIIDGIGDLLIKLTDVLVEHLPEILEKGEEILMKLLEGIVTVLPQIIPVVSQIILKITQSLIQMLPQILQAGIDILLELIKGISEALPDLIPMMVTVILDMVDILLDNIDEIIECGIELLVALTEGIMNALPELMSRLPEIIIKITSKLVELSPQLFSAALRIILALAEGLIKYVPEMISRIPQIIKSIINAFSSGIGDMKQIGSNLLKGVWNGISDTISWLKNKIAGMGSTITKAIKNVFGIHSPSKVMKNEVGKFLPMGIAEGFEDEIPNTIKDVDNAMAELNKGIQTSVNPTINTSASTNPLILQIENFNNTRATDIQALAEELEFYRKNASLATGGK